jgi:DNA-directed RNA polymerase subunit K/omega
VPEEKDRKAGVFEIVTVASARARQLAGGCVPKVDGSAKLARRALEEVRSGRVARTERGKPGSES